MDVLLFFFLFVALVIWLIIKLLKYFIKCNREESLAQKKIMLERKQEQILKDARHLLLLAEVMRQAKAAGDTETVEAVNNMTYQGQIPEYRTDGAPLSIYDNVRIFKIAGMSYRGNLSSYEGDFKGILKSEPTNEYDPMAIRVQVEDGKHVGYIREEQTEMVRSMIGEGEDFKPYRITGFIRKNTDETDGHTFYDGWIYLTKKD